MRLLLDTHALLWLLDGDAALSPAAHTAISDAQNEKLLSVSSLWEITIKTGLGKLALKQTLPEFLGLVEQTRAVQPLAIRPPHLLRLATLPHHHRDPFDRLIIAQALSENCTLVSRDGQLDAYGVSRLW